MIAKILKHILSKSLFEEYINWRQRKVIEKFKQDPKSLAIKDYKKIFGSYPDMNNPKNLIEKILWLQFNSDTSAWTRCADKYRVRNYVNEKQLNDTLCKLYGVWKNADEIDFKELPNKFVLKTNNSCGQIIIVQDKNSINEENIRQILNKWLKQGYGYHNGQVHYTRIEPCIIAEELLEMTKGESLTDYKIWCFNGEPECILVCQDRVAGQAKYSLSMYDTNWVNISTTALNSLSSHFCGKNIPKPKNLEQMLEIARRLSAGFPEVRVDLYNIKGRIIFGELTFTSGYGSYKKEFYDYLGSKVILPNKTTEF